jgi:hypothetical protein
VPIATITEGRDEIFAMFATAWATLGTPPPIIYPDKPNSLPDTGPYVKLNIQHVPSGQRTLGGKPSQGGGGRRFRRVGIFTVQIFTEPGDGLTTADTLVNLIMDTFEGESTGSDRIEFRDVTPTEVGTIDAMTQTNVSMTFEYDRVK